MTTTQKAVLLHPMGSMGEQVPVDGLEWSGVPGDSVDEYRRKVRLEPLGSLPWDHAAGDAA